eukprot:3317537-Alexandrium_andersonii.AAC.1
MSGRFPSCRHNGDPFRDTDGVRSSCAGGEMGWQGILLLLKGDWMEVSNSLGVPNWASKYNPCPL